MSDLFDATTLVKTNGKDLISILARNYCGGTGFFALATIDVKTHMDSSLPTNLGLLVKAKTESKAFQIELTNLIHKFLES